MIHPASRTALQIILIIPILLQILVAIGLLNYVSVETRTTTLLCVAALGLSIIISILMIRWLTRSTIQQTEAALQKNEAKFRRLIEANLIGVNVSHFDGRILEANDIYLEMVGCTRDDLEAGAVDWLKMTPPEYLDLDRQANNNLRITGIFTPFEKEYIRKDGSRVPVLIGHAMFDEEHEFSIGFVLDLTERKQAEAALQKSEAKFRRLIEANLIGVSVADFDSEIFEANDIFLEMVGYSRDDLRAGAVSWLKMTPPEYLDIDRQATENLRTQGIFTPFEKEYIRKDGSRVPVLIGHAAYDEEHEFSIGFVLDLTERKRAEAAVRKSEAKFRRLIEANLIGACVSNLDGKILEANDSFLEMVGYTQTDLQTGALNWQKMTPPEYSHLDRQAVETLRTKGMFTPFEKEYIRKDGSRVPVLVGHAVFDKDQEIAIGFILDLSDRKQAEAASVLEERNRIARDIHDTLAQSFTSILVHLDVAFRKLDSDRDMAQSCLQTSYELAQTGLAEARRSVAALRPVYLDQRSLYNALCLLATQIFAHSSTQLVFRQQGKTYPLPQAVEDGLFRIGQEALMNACKYAQATEVQIELSYESAYCRLRVKDNGVGFVIDCVSTGSSFGLVGMKERAERIKADLTVQSTPGKGTAIIVTVKRGQADEFT